MPHMKKKVHSFFFFLHFINSLRDWQRKTDRQTNKETSRQTAIKQNKAYESLNWTLFIGTTKQCASFDKIAFSSGKRVERAILHAYDQIVSSGYLLLLLCPAKMPRCNANEHSGLTLYILMSFSCDFTTLLTQTLSSFPVVQSCTRVRAANSFRTTSSVKVKSGLFCCI